MQHRGHAVQPPAPLTCSELNAIPNDLRICLEQALAEDASQESLNMYLPTIRQIIYNLLDGLKRKQAQYKRSLAEREEVAESHGGLYAPQPAGQGLAHSQSHGQLPYSATPVAQGSGSGAGSVTRRPVPPTINEDDRLSVSGRSVVSVASMGSTHSAPAAQVHAAVGRVSPTPRQESLNKMPSSSALAERERERERARGGQSQRPAPPDAFRPPRRVPSDGQPVRSSPSPKPPQAPLPESRGVQLKDDGPVPSPPPSGKTFHASTSTALAPSAPSAPPAPLPPPKAPSRIDRYSRDRDSFGNPKPVSRFSADSDITNGSPIKSPPSRSPPAGIRPLSEEDDGDGADDSFAASGSKTSFSALSDAPSLPKLELPSVSLLDVDHAADSRSGSTPPPPPPPDLPPESKSTLATLRGFDPLERRASKRFSSYTFNKMVPSSPPSKGRKQSNLASSAGSDSPQRPARRVEREGVPPMPSLSEALAAQKGAPSALGTSPGSDSGGLHPDQASGASGRSASPGRSDESSHSMIVRTPPGSNVALPTGGGGASGGPTPRASPSPSVPATTPGAETAEQVVKPRDDGTVSVFLQVGRQVKKASLEQPITISTLRLLFMERFEYDPGMDDFPEVYVNDRRTGVAFELEEMEDVKEGCVLSLNIERE